MVDAPKDKYLEVEAERKELDSLIKNYKNNVHLLIQRLTNFPHYECTTSYNTTQENDIAINPKICPKELPICSNYKTNSNFGTCTNSDINMDLLSIKESESQIKEKLNKIHNYNSVHIKDFNDNEKILNKSHTKLVNDMDDLKESKKQLKRALQYHDDLTGKNSSLKIKTTSNYIKYLLWIILFLITIVITVLSFINPNLVPTEIVIIYVSFVCIIAFISSPYFYLN